MPTEPEFLDDQGVARKLHYGDGRQPWDVLLEETPWAPNFAAANVLKYLRRTKDVDDSRKKARWYHARLVELCASDDGRLRCDAVLALCQLSHLLTVEEHEILKGTKA